MNGPRTKATLLGKFRARGQLAAVKFNRGWTACSVVDAKKTQPNNTSASTLTEKTIKVQQIDRILDATQRGNKLAAMKIHNEKKCCFTHGIKVGHREPDEPIGSEGYRERMRKGDPAGCDHFRRHTHDDHLMTINLMKRPNQHMKQLTSNPQSESVSRGNSHFAL
ncbi:MAG: hypothetical protein VYA84_04470 [Planctomycetota bacterium]|nr:hypothetical protein [Planctomycetota bacterium]